MRGPGAIPAFCLPKKERGTPHAKVEPDKTKERLHETNYEKRERGRLKKYEANLQEKTTAGRIFSSAQRDFHPGIERWGDRRVRLPNFLRGPGDAPVLP